VQTVVCQPARSLTCLQKSSICGGPGRSDAAEELHRRLLPLINLETYPFMRYMLKRRGVFTTLIERAPSAAEQLDAEDRREITILLEAVRDENRTLSLWAGIGQE
jgi:hypothetical protein